METHAVELVRRGSDAITRGDLDTLADLLDPGVCWHGDGAEGDGCDGRVETMRFIRDTLRGGAPPRLLEVMAVGENAVAVLAPPPNERSDEATNDAHGTLVTIRAGRITRMIVYATPEAALPAGKQRERNPR